MEYKKEKKNIVQSALRTRLASNKHASDWDFIKLKCSPDIKNLRLDIMPEASTSVEGGQTEQIRCYIIGHKYGIQIKIRIDY